MTLHVLCPECSKRYEVADEQAGRTGTCPTCGTVARIPAIGSSAGTPPPAGQPTYSPYVSPQHPAGPQGSPYGDQAYFYQLAVANFEVHRKLLGIFGIVVGILTILWACFYGVFVVLAIAGELPDAPPEPGLQVVAGFYGVLAVLCIGTGILQITAGIWLLRRKRRCRNLGIMAAIVSCASMWGCFVWPFSLGFGIYALVILCGRGAIMVLGAQPGSPEPGPFPWGREDPEPASR